MPATAGVKRSIGEMIDSRFGGNDSAGSRDSVRKPIARKPMPLPFITRSSMIRVINKAPDDEETPGCCD